MLDATVTREMRCVHLAGHSPLKNTGAVIDAWRHDPTLPPLTIISASHYEVPAGVRMLTGYLTDAELTRELNAARIHLCPSAAEGWGHYITEALTIGATVIATDGSPMNEQVRPEHGILLPPSAIGRRHYAAHHHIDPSAIINAVRHAVSLPLPNITTRWASWPRARARPQRTLPYHRARPPTKGMMGTFAYADPPYVGQARRHYGKHKDYAAEVDHAELIGRLERDYDGWAPSASMKSIPTLARMLPPDVLTLAWVKPIAPPMGTIGTIRGSPCSCVRCAAPGPGMSRRTWFCLRRSSHSGRSQRVTS
jgi:hypothetical protein